MYVLYSCFLETQREKMYLKILGNSLVIQWLGLCSSTAWVLALMAGELGSYKLHGGGENLVTFFIIIHIPRENFANV